MPRNMSFMLTTEQIYNQTKTVTRRLGWDFIKPGDLVNACEKCQGLKKGEKVVRIAQIRIKSVEKEPLFHITDDECRREGFFMMEPMDFVEMFCDHNKCTPETLVNRIEFEYILPNVPLRPANNKIQRRITTLQFLK